MATAKTSQRDGPDAWWSPAAAACATVGGMGDRRDSRLRSLHASLQPQLQALEGRRLRLRNLTVAGVVCAALGAWSCYTAFSPPPALLARPEWRYGPLFFSLLGLVCIGLAIGRCLVPGVVGYVNYRAHFKKDVVAAVVCAVLPGARYFADRHLKREVYERSRLFRTALDGFRGDDLLQGTIGDTPFECSELEAFHYSGSQDERRTQHSDFAGLLFRVDLDRDLQGHTVVQPRKAAGGDRSGMNRVEIDPAFDREFDVYSTHPGEARALLDAGVRARLLELAERARAPLHLAFAGGVAYAGFDYGKHLFEPHLAAALGEEELAALAEPLLLAEALVVALGLERRRRAADPRFHENSVTVSGMEGLARRIVTQGDAGLSDMATLSEEETGPPSIEPPRHALLARLTDTGVGLEVRYPPTFGTLVLALLALCATSLAAVAAWNWADPAFAARAQALLAERAPAFRAAGQGVLSHPVPLLLGSLFVGWIVVGTLLHRPRRVQIDAESVRVSRLLLPWPATLPLAAVRAVESQNRSLTIVRSDRGLLRSRVIASPLLRSDHEALWLAAQLRQAMRRVGWRPTGLG